LFEWWRPQLFWSAQREEALMSWIYTHSFISAHSSIGPWEEWMQETQRIVPIHEAKEKAARIWPLSLCLAS
jgi:hypothetical protein